MRPSSTLAPTLALALALAGCAETPPPREGAHPETPVAFRTLLHTSHQPILDVDGGVAMDDAAWNETWAKYASTLSPSLPPPFVDRSSEQLFAVATGQHTSGCNDVRVVNVTRGDGELVLRYDVYSGEAPNRACTGQMVWPTQVIAVSDLTPGVRFLSTVVDSTDGWPPGPRNETPWLERVEPRPIDAGSFSGIHNDTRLLLRDAASWEALWSEHRAGELAPTIAFARENVVAVVVHGPTGCAGIHLGPTWLDSVGDVLHVEVVHERAPENVQCLVAFEDVFVFVAVPAHEDEVSFRDSEGAAPGS